MEDPRPISVLRPSRRQVPRRQRAPGPGGGARRAEHRSRLRGQGRLAHVSRRASPGVSAAPPSWLRDRDRGAPGPPRSLGLDGRRRPLRRRRRPVVDGGEGDPARRDVPVAEPLAAQPGGVVSNLVEPSGGRQDGRGALLDALEPHDSATHGARRRGEADGGHRGGGAARRDGCRGPRAAASFVGRARRHERGDLDHQDGGGRDVDAATGGPRHQPDAVFFPGRGGSAPGAR